MMVMWAKMKVLSKYSRLSENNKPLEVVDFILKGFLPTTNN